MPSTSEVDLDRIIRLPELLTLTGLSRASIYRQIAAGQFPAPVSITANTKGWFASAIKAWQQSLKAAAMKS